MAESSISRCDNCGFEAPNGSEEWQAVVHPPIGTLTQCPDCGSTNVYSRQQRVEQVRGITDVGKTELIPVNLQKMVGQGNRLDHLRPTGQMRASTTVVKSVTLYEAISGDIDDAFDRRSFGIFCSHREYLEQWGDSERGNQYRILADELGLSGPATE